MNANSRTQLLKFAKASRIPKYSQLPRIPDAYVSNATHTDAPEGIVKTARCFPSSLIKKWIHRIHLLIKHGCKRPQNNQNQWLNLVNQSHVGRSMGRNQRLLRRDLLQRTHCRWPQDHQRNGVYQQEHTSDRDQDKVRTPDEYSSP